MTPPIFHASPAPGDVVVPCCGMSLNEHSALLTADPARVTCPGDGRAPRTREQLHARVFDVLRRSGVADAEALIRAMEVDAATVSATLTTSRRAIELLVERLDLEGVATSFTSAPLLRDIDRALSGHEIGPPKETP